MRISDWRSDVCASDLVKRLPAQFRAGGAMFLGQAAPCLGDQVGGFAVGLLASGDGGLLGLGDRLAQHGIEFVGDADPRSEEHTSELQSLMSISYAGCSWKKKKNTC